MAGMGPETEHRERRDVLLESTSRGPSWQSREEGKQTAKVIAGGSITEALAGLAVVVLAILGLAGAMPLYLAAVATIAVGVAFLAQGGTIATRWSKVVDETPGYEWDPKTELGSGMTGEILGGATGIVLGILALIRVAPQTLIPVALLVFGGALLLGTGTTVDLGQTRGAGMSRFDRSTHEITVAASGTQMLIGISALVLGILALIGIDPLTLSLVGLLATGASILFSGSAISSHMLGIVRR